MKALILKDTEILLIFNFHNQQFTFPIWLWKITQKTHLNTVQYRLIRPINIVFESIFAKKHLE